MSESIKNPRPEDTKHRLVVVEELVTHLERNVQVLHEVLLEQQQRLERLEFHIDRIAREIGEAGEGMPPRRLEDDKPPHY